jgi:translation initiation factor IF-3
MARGAGLDLVEVAAQERPPVCKIMDYGKFKFELGRKKQKCTETTGHSGTFVLRITDSGR